MKLGVIFNLPFRFIDEGEYELSYKKVSVKINVKLVQNYEAAEKIMGMKIETSGEGAKVDMNADYHGIVNFTRIKMEISDKTDCTIECPFDATDKTIKITAMQMVNKLAEVVRYTTNNYWIRFVNLRDIMNFQIFDLSFKPPMAIISFNPCHGYSLPNFKIIEQSEVKDQIKQALIEETRLPTWKSILLDSINYFTIERYNEAVIISNVALESFIAEFLYNKLTQQFPDPLAEFRKLPKGLHDIMRKHFPKIDGRKLEDDQTLWKKFDNIRTIIRPCAMHSFTTKIVPRTSFQTIQGIREIINWADPTVKI